jgi:FtsP/CotA-like multicopper oxidase with cupredoxin domain
LRAQTSVPAQVVRFRILNGAIERSYNIGFSDNRSFSVIGSDGGLLNAPVPLTRYLLHAGERIEILVNFNGQAGQSVDLKAYNSSLAQNVPGGDLFPNGPFANFLARKDFNMLHIKVAAQTSNPITTIPTTLKTNVLLNAANAKITRKLSMIDSMGVTNPPILGGVAFVINRKLFDINYIEYKVPLGNTEIWEINSTSNFGHPFHIHDVEFNILSINGAAPPAAQAGWKDVVFVPARQTVRFIAKFEDYADALHPFMYHCHIALHEDEGMMGQFVVTGPSATGEPGAKPDFSLFPNPAQDKIFVNMDDPDAEIYYLKITDAVGRVKLMLPQPQVSGGVDISKLSPGTYFVQITERATKQVLTQKFVKQ